ncbi:unnamed protein product [Lampetra planeri]
MEPQHELACGCQVDVYVTGSGTSLRRYRRRRLNAARSDESLLRPFVEHIAAYVTRFSMPPHARACLPTRAHNGARASGRYDSGRHRYAGGPGHADADTAQSRTRRWGGRAPFAGCLPWH